jgi:hypothetical protein
VYVAAHSTDHFHHPLSEYSGFIWYPVELKGYFNDPPVAYLPLINKSFESMADIKLPNPYPEPEELNQRKNILPIPYPSP